MFLAVHDVIWGHSFPELFRMGGPVMWPILACSVVAVAIIVERAVVFARVRGLPPALEDDVVAAIERQDIDAARSLCDDSRDLSAAVLETQLGLVDADEDVRREAVQREGGLAIERLERRLSPLALVAQISPLLGLLGTVSGLVASFWQLEQADGPVQPSDLAAGIWAALLTTVFGLIVGIPSSAASHLLQDRVDAFARRLGFTVTRVEGALWHAANDRTSPRSTPAGPGRANGPRRADRSDAGVEPAPAAEGP
ncbi:MAG: MotA/TolQ/ExbB proton channel family protein [Planctomycetota bacterium]